MSSSSTPDSSPSTISVKLEFGGGMELLFNNTRSHRVTLPSCVPESTRPSDVTFLIRWLSENLLTERKELFVDGETVRPGILVLINDTDWELEGEGGYVLKDGDEVVFISTLHG
ncbi:Ubiquitin- modifier 1, partial [Tulasnella sp. 403]